MIAALVLALTGMSGSPSARAASASNLRQRINAGQGRLSGLSGRVQAAGRRVGALSSGIAALEGRITTIQGQLDADRSQLLTLRGELTAARQHLGREQAAEQRDQALLATQLVGSYEGARPDLVSVVLEATGFQDLLNRLDFASRVSQHDAGIVGRVRAARRALAAEATRLGTLSQRQQTLTVRALGQRDALARTRLSLVDQQLTAARARETAGAQLASARGQVASLQHQLGAVEAAARRATTAPAGPGSTSGASGSSSGSSSGPVTAPSSGGFTFPMPKADASPVGTWSLDDGVDISAPGGTPELAVCSGTVVLHGIGGFGPSAPVIHCDSPLAGFDYVYYGHAGPGNWTPIGTHVSQGQVISEVGDGIVGISTGPHLELGFADSSGSPVGPSSAPQMMSLLRAAYGA
ncbi:MAG: murein hydrolase activator EnvC family protein [Solirubrobacteraceae bacterium]